MKNLILIILSFLVLTSSCKDDIRVECDYSIKNHQKQKYLSNLKNQLNKYCEIKTARIDKIGRVSIIFYDEKTYKTDNYPTCKLFKYETEIIAFCNGFENGVYKNVLR